MLRVVYLLARGRSVPATIISSPAHKNFAESLNEGRRLTIQDFDYRRNYEHDDVKNQ
jgi:hypothetical protein